MFYKFSRILGKKGFSLIKKAYLISNSKWDLNKILEARNILSALTPRKSALYFIHTAKSFVSLDIESKTKISIDLKKQIQEAELILEDILFKIRKLENSIIDGEKSLDVLRKTMYDLEMLEVKVNNKPD